MMLNGVKRGVLAVARCHISASRATHSLTSARVITNQIAKTQTCFQKISALRQYNSQSSPSSGNPSIVEVLEREIQDEVADLNQQLSTDQFPGFSVETNDADVKLTKQANDAVVTVRFTVSSSLNEWPEADNSNQNQQQDGAPGYTTALVSMPEFQVQIIKNGRTLEMSCYFEEMDQDDDTGEPLVSDPVFGIDELVIYDGEPKETEFAASADYFPEDLQNSLLDYLREYGIDEDFAKNLVQFSTNYEKKQYVGLIKRLKTFVSQ